MKEWSSQREFVEKEVVTGENEICYTHRQHVSREHNSCAHLFELSMQTLVSFVYIFIIFFCIFNSSEKNADIIFQVFGF